MDGKYHFIAIGAAYPMSDEEKKDYMLGAACDGDDLGCLLRTDQVVVAGAWNMTSTLVQGALSRHRMLIDWVGHVVGVENDFLVASCEIIGCNRNAQIKDWTGEHKAQVVYIPLRAAPVTSTKLGECLERALAFFEARRRLGLEASAVEREQGEHTLPARAWRFGADEEP